MKAECDHLNEENAATVETMEHHYREKHGYSPLRWLLGPIVAAMLVLGFTPIASAGGPQPPHPDDLTKPFFRCPPIYLLIYNLTNPLHLDYRFEIHGECFRVPPACDPTDYVCWLAWVFSLEDYYTQYAIQVYDCTQDFGCVNDYACGYYQFVLDEIDPANAPHHCR